MTETSMADAGAKLIRHGPDAAGRVPLRGAIGRSERRR